MHRVVVVSALLSSACSFTHGNLAEGDGGTRVDGAPDTSMVVSDASPDAAPGAICVGQGLTSICMTNPTSLLKFDNAEQINTDTDPRCITVTQSSGPPLCAIVAQNLEVNNVVTAIGSRPLVLAAAVKLKISGTLDVSSLRGGITGAGANSSLCGTASAPGNSTGGGGGGAGGSFGGRGGDGAIGDTNGSNVVGSTAAAAQPNPPVIRGGCSGRAGGSGSTAGDIGTPGSSGGAVYLVAGTEVEVAGNVFASGAGAPVCGLEAGGGGGGSGGMIGIDAPTITVSGSLIANGGGGAEGGILSRGGDFGDNGSTNTTTLAAGGSGTNMDGGDGGAGTNATTTDGGAGQPDIGGAGGGGGGAGVIWLVNPPSGGQISPPPELH